MQLPWGKCLSFSELFRAALLCKSRLLHTLLISSPFKKNLVEVDNCQLRMALNEPRNCKFIPLSFASPGFPLGFSCFLTSIQLRGSSQAIFTSSPEIISCSPLKLSRDALLAPPFLCQRMESERKDCAVKVLTFDLKIILASLPLR